MSNYTYTPDDLNNIKSWRFLKILDEGEGLFNETQRQDILRRIYTQFYSDLRNTLKNGDSVKIALLNTVSDKLFKILDNTKLRAEADNVREANSFIRSYLKPIRTGKRLGPNLQKAKDWIDEAELLTKTNYKNFDDIENFFKSNKKGMTLNYIPKTKYWLKKLLKNILKYDNQVVLDIEYDDGTATYYTIGRNKLNNIIRNIENDREITEEETNSDFEFRSKIRNIVYLVINKFIKTKKTLNGRWFKYTHDLDNINLERYGIYTSKTVDSVETHCLYKSLEKGGLSESKLLNLKKFITATSFPRSKFKELCESLKIYIKVYDYKPICDENTNKIIKWNSHIGKFGNPEHDIYELCLIDEHYFIKDKKTKITKYAINNYQEIKNEKDWNFIVSKLKNGKYKRDKREERALDSASLVKLLFENKDTFLKPILFNEEDLKSTIRLHLDTDYETLEYSDKSAVGFINKKKLEFIGCPGLSEDGTRFLDKNINKYYYKTSSIINIEYIEDIIETHFRRQCICDNINECDYIKYANGESIEIPKTTIGKRTFKSDSIDRYERIFWDVETYKGKNAIHTLYYIGSYNATRDEYKGFRGPKAVDEFLDSLPKNSVLWAHNAGYDWRFLLSSNQIKIHNYLKKGTGIYTVNGQILDKNTKKNFIIKDTYKIISSPLSKFGSLFNLSIKKEVMPYDLYSKKVIDNPIIKMIKASNHLSNEDYKQLVNNSKDWNIITYCHNHKDNKNIDSLYSCGDCLFDSVEYAAKYCELDCKVLAQGYDTMKRWLYEATCSKRHNGELIENGLNADNYVSISSLVDSYLKKEGCYYGCAKLTGIPQDFISKAIVGGRVMCANNEKIIVKDKELSDFDAVSLYTSAMTRMPGFLKGKPKVITDDILNYKKPYEFLNKYTTSYFVEIEITKIGKNRTFPLQSYKNDGGIRNFTNDIVGKKFILDKTALQDLVEFQEAEFKIIRGYYFDEGYNEKIKHVMKNLFDTRLKFKEQGNPIQNAFKLMMNSSYGKTILKAPELDYRIFNNENDFWTYYCKNNFKIKQAHRLAWNKFIVYTYKSLLSHYNYPHIGCEILSMSKRIMNEVMCLAEDNNINIYYQDTDSIHMEFDKVDTLVQLFKDKYNRTLIGKSLGQFHTDFELDGAIGSSIKSKKSIFLGKKCYIDCLEGENKEGDIIKGYHIRMKGVPSKCVINTAKNMGVGLFELYEKHYRGETITYDLVNDSGRVFFEQLSNLHIRSRNEFKRTLKF